MNKPHQAACEAAHELQRLKAGLARCKRAAEMMRAIADQHGRLNFYRCASSCDSEAKKWDAEALSWQRAINNHPLSLKASTTVEPIKYDRHSGNRAALALAKGGES